MRLLSPENVLILIGNSLRVFTVHTNGAERYPEISREYCNGITKLCSCCEWPRVPCVISEYLLRKLWTLKSGLVARINVIYYNLFIETPVRILK